MTKQTAQKKVSKATIYRAVASSSAIETGIPTAVLERKLKAKKGKYHQLALAV